MTPDHNPLIVALDVPTLEEARELARALAPVVGYLKVGLELFAAAGPSAVHAIAEYAPVFLDLKLHDIPTTVERATRRLGGIGVAMVTAHAAGGAAMIAAAVAGLRDGSVAPGRPAALLAVTVLTSMSDDDLASVNAPPVATQAPHLARAAIAAGADGVVCAPTVAAVVRAAVGPAALVVTPGVRPEAHAGDDHAAARTPAAALRAGASYVVVGRPVTRADDPVAAARAILDEVATAARA